MKPITHALATFFVITAMSCVAYSQESSADHQVVDPANPDSSIGYGQAIMCRSDINKLCAGDPYDSKTIKCLHDNQYNLSDQCSKTLKDSNPNWKHLDTPNNNAAGSTHD